MRSLRARSTEAEKAEWLQKRVFDPSPSSDMIGFPFGDDI